MTRPTYVYRIDVEFPTDENGRELPPNDAGDQYEYEDGSVPRWPRVRQFLAPRQAERRAALLIERGAVSAVVRRSKAVEWPDP